MKGARNYRLAGPANSRLCSARFGLDLLHSLKLNNIDSSADRAKVLAHMFLMTCS
jgi:hypothetical protein